MHRQNINLIYDYIDYMLLLTLIW